MLTLDATTKKIEIVTSGATVALDGYAQYTDINVATPLATPKATHVAIVTATTTDIVSAPAANEQRKIGYLSLANKSTTGSVEVTVQLDVSGTNYQLFKTTLRPGGLLAYVDGIGWSAPSVNNLSGFAAEFYKAGTASEAIGQWYCYSKDAGFPGAWATGSPGMAGRATDGTLTADAGCLAIPNAASGNANYLVGATAVASVVQQVAAWDVMWVQTGIAVATTTAQAINSVAFPARDLNGATAGKGVRIGLLVTTATTNAGTTAPTLSYTNSAGTPGQTATMTFPATAVAGTVVWFTLAAGDDGVQSIQSITLNTSLVTGAVSLIAARQLVQVPIVTANVGAFAPLGNLGVGGAVGGVRLYDGVCVLLFHRAVATTATNIDGQLYIETR